MPSGDPHPAEMAGAVTDMLETWNKGLQATVPMASEVATGNAIGATSIAGTELTEAEGKLLKVTLDAIPERIAIVGEDGRCVCRNEQWVRVSTFSVGRPVTSGGDLDYVEFYGAVGIRGAEVPKFAARLREVISGARSAFSAE